MDKINKKIEGTVNIIDKIPLNILAIGTMTLGMAPFMPIPHLFEKIIMLFQGQLYRPLDIFDLLMHGTFPTLLALKISFLLFRKFSKKNTT